MAKKTSTTKIMLNITSSILHLFLNIIFYLLVILVIIKCGQLAYSFSYQVFGSVSVSEEGEGRDYTFTIKEKQSTMAVASELQNNGMIVNKYSFYLRAKLTQQKIQPGTYTINSSMSYDDIFAVITIIDKEKQKQHGG